MRARPSGARPPLQHGRPDPDPLRKVSPALFVVVVFLFFLPFVSCNGVEVSGVQAATGITPPGSDPDAIGLAEPPDAFALISLLCAVAGIVLIRLGRTRGPLASALAAVAGSFALIGSTVVAMLRAHDELGIEIGLTLAFLGFLLAAAVNDLLLARVPLVAIADDEGLARQGARTAVWFAGIGAAITTTLLLSASLTKPGVDHAAPYLIGGLIPVAILTSVALAFAIRGYRRAVRPSSPDENGEPSAWSPRARGARPPSSGTQADHNPSDA